MRFTNKTAFVTGAAHGIGKSVAELMAAEGCTVVAVDINYEPLCEVVRGINEKGGKAIAFKLDVSNEDEVNEVCAKALEKVGKLDILVNNAGIFNCDRGPFHESRSENWRKKIGVNVLGLMYVTRAFINHMYENGSGSIVNVSSVAAIYGIADMPDYSMTKGAVTAFTKALSREAAPRGVRVNSVSPGNVGSGLDDRYNLSYIGRSGTWEEHAKVILFLASDDASFVSGSDYVVDGCRKKI